MRFPAPYLGSAPAALTVETTPEQRWSEPANAYVAQLEHFHACITRGATCLSPAADGARDVALLTALYREAVLGMSGAVIVTGSDSGIGRATAIALARAGHPVGVTWHTTRPERTRPPTPCGRAGAPSRCSGST